MQDLKTILLVEDHPNDVELTLEALADCRLANDIVVVNDGEATLDSTTPIGAAGSRGASPRPRRWCSSTSRCPRWTDSRLRTVKADPALKPIPIVRLTSSCQERDLVESYPLGAKKRGRRIHRARTWAGGLCASLLALAAVNCRAGETAPAPSTNAARVPAESGVAQLKKLSLEELMDIEVTSVSKRPERLSETASAIQVITQEDIRRSGATRLPEALRLASNLEVAQIDSRRWAISARGFNSETSNKLLVLIDGRTVYTPLFAGVLWDVQDTLLEDIDRIEVISGPGATLWGANAVNGVINVITKNPKDTQGALLLGGGGTELNGFGGMRYGGALTPNLQYRVYGKYFDRDSTVLPDGRDASDDWHMGQGGFRMDWDASESNVFTVQADGYDGRISQAGADEIDVSGANVIGRWSHTFYEGSELQLQVYYDRTHRDIPNTFSEDLDTYDVDFQHRFPLGERHDIVWGLGYRLIEDDVSNTPAVAFLPSQVSRQWFSGFVQDEIALVKDRLHLSLGTKIEHNDYTGFEFQPSGRLAWRLSEQQTLWSAISRAVRTPSRIDREFFQFPIDGGPDFDSEELLAYELGYRVQPFSRLALSLAAYYNDYDDLRSRESRPADSPVIELANGLEGESYGAELTVDYRVTDWWRLRAGYTELRIDLRPKPGSTDTTRGSFESNDSKHHFSLRSSLDLPGHWELDAAFRYVSRIDNQQVPAYGELDVRLGWRPSPELEFSIVGQNLLHDDHAEFGALTTRIETTRREIERGVFAKVLWRF
ncbi:MAG: TonB-dependent receptor [Pseudomonadota bacterium]|nr:TonB-dependent receptor [Pseudomonadota bacterium]